MYKNKYKVLEQRKEQRCPRRRWKYFRKYLLGSWRILRWKPWAHTTQLWPGMNKNIAINCHLLWSIFKSVKSFIWEQPLNRDIYMQRERIGGDWAVAHVVLYKEWRDIMRWYIYIFDCLNILGNKGRFLDRIWSSSTWKCLGRKRASDCWRDMAETKKLWSWWRFNFCNK